VTRDGTTHASSRRLDPSLLCITVLTTCRSFP
jgi:hypothetical protein